MPTRNSSPLTHQHYEALVRCLQSCAETGALIERCERCGLDLAELRQINQQQQQQADAIRREFFPDQP